jgi:hypothetical protein
MEWMGVSVLLDPGPCLWSEASVCMCVCVVYMYIHMYMSVY